MIVFDACTADSQTYHTCLADPAGPYFAAAVQQELERINAFYRQQELQLEVSMMAVDFSSQSTMSHSFPLL